MEPCTMKSEIEYIKKDIIDIKGNAKEQAAAMATMRDSHIETKIYIRNIQDSQAQMSKDTKENQANMIKGIQEIKEKPAKDAERIKWMLISFFIINIIGILKIFIK